MKRFFLNNNEIKLGDRVHFKTIKKGPGYSETREEITSLTEDILKLLIDEGVVRVKEYKDTAVDNSSNTEEEILENSNDKLYDKILKRVAGKLADNNLDKLHDIIVNMLKSYPYIVFNLFLKEIAIELDKKYSDYISDSEEIFVVTSIDGLICKVPKDKIVNYRNFAAFRSKEDAEFAIECLVDIYNIMYPEYHESKNKKCDCCKK